MKNQPDTFTESEVIEAILDFLNYGEETFNPDWCIQIRGHKGAYSGYGWAARVLRYHLDCLKAHQKDDLRRAEFHKELLKP